MSKKKKKPYKRRGKLCIVKNIKAICDKYGKSSSKCKKIKHKCKNEKTNN